MLQALRPPEPQALGQRRAFLELSPVEQVFTGAGASPISFSFRYARQLDADLIRHTLATTLRAFPLLRGRLVEDELLGRGVEPDGTLGALRFLSEPPTPGGEAELSLLVPGRLGSESARFTLAHDGAASVLSASMSRAVVDGFSFMHFMYSWARVARGLPPLRVTRQRIDGPPSGEPVSPEQVRAAWGAFWLPAQERRADVRRRVERRFFSQALLADGRAEARKARGVDLTDHELICARLWSELAPRGLAAEIPTFLTCPVDARPLWQRLGRSHFGCAISFATAALSLDRLRRSHVADVAHAIRKAIGAVDEQRVRASMQTLASLRAQCGARALDEIHLTHPVQGLLVTNLTSLPLEELDFGAGPPESFDVHGQLPRSALLFACPGGIEARVCTRAQGVDTRAAL